MSLLLCADHCDGFATERYKGDDAVRDELVVSVDAARAAVEAFLEAYAEQCAAHADRRDLHDLVLDSFGKEQVLRGRYEKAVRRAHGGKDFLAKSALAKAVDIERQPLRFRDRPERFARLSDDEQARWAYRLRPYVDDEVLDLVERIGAGTGSHNMRRFYLLVGPGVVESDDDLGLCHVVEVKQQRQAAPIHHFPELSPVNRLDPAHLTLVCQRRMQRDADLLLDEIRTRLQYLVDVGLEPRFEIDCLLCTDEEVGVYPGARYLAEQGYFSNHLVWLELGAMGSPWEIPTDTVVVHVFPAGAS